MKVTSIRSFWKLVSKSLFHSFLIDLVNNKIKLLSTLIFSTGTEGHHQSKLLSEYFSKLVHHGLDEMIIVSTSNY